MRRCGCIIVRWLFWKECLDACNLFELFVIIGVLGRMDYYFEFYMFLLEIFRKD